MNMFYGVLSRSGVPSDEQTVRATTETVSDDDEPAVQLDAPQQGQVETDSNPKHAGLATRQLASQWFQGEKFSPHWLHNVDAQAVNADIIDGQVSSSGTAAARESAGIFGHGSMSYAIGIEPVQGLTPGGAMTNNYFSADRPGIQSTSGAYMTTPPGYDKEVTALVSDTAKRNARYAKEASLYATWLGTAR